MKLSIHDRTLLRGTLQDRILRREIGEQGSFARVSGIYGDPHFVDSLDIVNELEGHSGCVNALRHVYVPPLYILHIINHLSAGPSLEDFWLLALTTELSTSTHINLISHHHNSNS